MTTFADELTDRFNELHADIGKVLDGLPSEALDWVPGSEMNSIAVLVIHLAGAEKYWIGVAGNKPPERDRDAEFRTKGMGVEELKTHLVSTDDFTRQALANISLKDLEKTRYSPRNGKTFTAGWCLAHALEHTALHAGHLQLTRQLWDQRKSNS